jgi:hypothetical protein
MKTEADVVKEALELRRAIVQWGADNDNASALLAAP